MDKLHITSINTQGLRNINKRNRFYAWCKQQKASIIFTQETHFTNDIISQVKSEWEGQTIHSVGTSNSRGVSIFIHKNINVQIQDTTIDENGRYIICNVTINDIDYSLICIYAPNENKRRNAFLRHIKVLTEGKGKGHLVMGGDWNDTQFENDRQPKRKRFKINCHLKKT